MDKHYLAGTTFYLPVAGMAKEQIEYLVDVPSAVNDLFNYKTFNPSIWFLTPKCYDCGVNTSVTPTYRATRLLKILALWQLINLMINHQDAETLLGLMSRGPGSRNPACRPAYWEKCNG